MHVVQAGRRGAPLMVLGKMSRVVGVLGPLTRWAVLLKGTTVAVSGYTEAKKKITRTLASA